MKKIMSKGKVIAMVSACLASVICVGSFAFFTDRVETSATATAATITLDLTANWTGATLLPGQKADLPSTIKSTGNRAMDVRETFVITSNKALSTTGQAEYEIYLADDVAVQANGSYAPKDGKNPVATEANRTFSNGDQTLTYVLEPFIMTGDEDAPEGTVGTEVTKNYVALFKADTDSTYQGIEVKVDYIVEAKQHAGTTDSDWTTLATKTVDGVTGSYVPNASQSAN